MLTKRTNILFDEDMWSQLTLAAKAEHTSVGKLIRIAVAEKYIENNDIQSIKKACKEIEKHRKHFKGKIDYKALINYGRKY